MKVFLIFISLSFLIQNVASLGLTVQPNTFVAHPTLLLWTRQPADGNNQLDFDLRFVEGMDKKDAGMAISGMHASPTQQFGTAQVVFPTHGTYEVIAVTDPNHNIGTSNNINAIVFPSASSTVVGATQTSSLMEVAHPISYSRLAFNLTSSNAKVPIIVGSIVGALIFVGVLLMLLVFFTRRRQKTSKRWTFHREMMVRCHQPPPVIAQTSSSTSSASDSQDLEQGLNTLAVPSMQQPSRDPELSLPDPIVRRPRGHRPVPRRLALDCFHHTPLPRAPIGPRLPLIHQSHSNPGSSLPRSAKATSPGPRSPMPRSPSPRTHRQRAIADQIEILRIQILEFEREGRKDDVTMNAMCQKLAWLREQQEGPWALGLTEVTPLGYDRYMT